MFKGFTKMYTDIVPLINEDDQTINSHEEIANM